MKDTFEILQDFKEQGITTVVDFSPYVPIYSEMVETDRSSIQVEPRTADEMRNLDLFQQDKKNNPRPSKIHPSERINRKMKAKIIKFMQNKAAIQRYRGTQSPLLPGGDTIVYGVECDSAGNVKEAFEIIIEPITKETDHGNERIA